MIDEEAKGAERLFDESLQREKERNDSGCWVTTYVGLSSLLYKSGNLLNFCCTICH
jgi:hypothetical protein